METDGISRDYFWLSDEQAAKLQPHLPTDTRGKPRVDDRRVTGGIIHVLKSGERWVDAPAVYGPRKTLYNRFQRWRATGVDTDRFLSRACASLRLRRQRGERGQAICRSRGGRTTKIHALTDGLWRPVAFLLTGGNVADCTAGETRLEPLPDTGLVNDDKGYDSNAIRRQIGDR